MTEAIDELGPVDWIVVGARRPGVMRSMLLGGPEDPYPWPARRDLRIDALVDLSGWVAPRERNPPVVRGAERSCRCTEDEHRCSELTFPTFGPHGLNAAPQPLSPLPSLRP